MLAEQKWHRGARRCLVALLAVGAVAAAVGPLASAPGDDMVPDLQVRFMAPFTPKEMAARGSTPIQLSLSETVRYQSDGGPALGELEVDLDRHLGLSVEDLPSCPRPFGGRDPRTDTLVKCEDAKVGSGTIEVKVAFPEQQPVWTTGRVYVYNGGFKDGHTTFWLYSLIPAPVTGVILVPLEVRRYNQGFYGWSGQLKLPKIANGSGSVTNLEVRFRRGIFSARCPTGRLRARAVSRFVDGSALTSSTAPVCWHRD